MDEQIKYLKNKIREIPDWPKPGVSFKDITTLLQDKDAFRKCIDLICEPLVGKKIDKVVGIDARGFIFAAPAAYRLGAGLVIVRKKGRLPSETIEQDYELEYGSATMQAHTDSISKGERVVIVDDLLATGGTSLAVCDLVKKLGGEITELVFAIDLPFLGGGKKLSDKGYKARSLIVYGEGN